MKVLDVTRQYVICELNLEEIEKCRQVEKEWKPNKNNGYRYISMVLGNCSSGLYEIQKYIFRKAFGNEKSI